MSRKIINIIYLLLGSVFPILVGVLHTWTHFQDLTTAKIRLQLSSTIDIMGTEQSVWNTWGLMSFMMGASFIIIGLLHLVIIQKRSRETFPTVQAWSTIILYLICVVYAAKTFSAVPQYYGGIIGLCLALTCVALTLKSRNQATP